MDYAHSVLARVNSSLFMRSSDEGRFRDTHSKACFNRIYALIGSVVSYWLIIIAGYAVWEQSLSSLSSLPPTPQIRRWWRGCPSGCTNCVRL